MNNLDRRQLKPVFPTGIYGITADAHALGRSSEEVVRAMIAGGVRIIQYRSKESPTSQRRKLEECRRLRALTREAGVLLIVNDHVDLAMIVDADGVHVGQDDLPVEDVRTLVGPRKLIGLSTHSRDQARQAVKSGADYIGVGPVYATHTKSDAVAPVGLDLVDFAARHIPIPFAAIGGIKSGNIGEVAAHGAKTICLVTEIVVAADIAATVQSLLRQMSTGKSWMD